MHIHRHPEKSPQSRTQNSKLETRNPNMAGADHCHDGHGHRIVGRKRLGAAIILTVVVMIVEVVGGLLANSLALLSDAGHMLTHIFALGMSFFAIILAARPATKEKTYGYFRAEVLAAFINGIVLLFITIYILYEAVLRIMTPVPVKATEMFLVALLGLIANGASVILLGGVGHKDINIRSAFLHVIGDTASSVAVVIGAIVMAYTGKSIVDPILSVLISVLIVIWAFRLFHESGNILLESAPKHLDIDEVSAFIKEKVEGVNEVHDVHLWVLTSYMYAMTAHILVDDIKISQSEEILRQINQLVAEEFNISHTNIQFESPQVQL
ncbi:MAG: cation diffusion facilitator family transporter [bacterium]|nr:cation diffusion facilitator family transporter [bacterium]